MAAAERAGAAGDQERAGEGRERPGAESLGAPGPAIAVLEGSGTSSWAESVLLFFVLFWVG